MKLIKFYIIFGLCALGATVKASERTISAGGSITEIMYALGLGDEIIAVDSSSYFPLEASTKPKVGYFRSLSSEGVLSLNPTRLVASSGAGPGEALQQIKDTGVAVKVFKQEIYTFESWKSYLQEVGHYFNVEDRAVQIINRVESRLAQVKALSDVEKRTAIFLMDVGDRGPVAAGKNTVPNMLFELSQFKNIVTQFEGYKPFSAEQLIQTKPDVIVMPSHVVAKLGGVEGICKNMTIALTTADSGCEILVLDALLALGFGTRIDQAVEILTRYEH